MSQWLTFTTIFIGIVAIWTAVMAAIGAWRAGRARQHADKYTHDMLLELLMAIEEDAAIRQALAGHVTRARIACALWLDAYEKRGGA